MNSVDSEIFFDNFSSPGKEFRGMPFWAWNARLDETELRRQIRTFHEMGFGGFFMHSRVGLNTEYLGKEWFNCIKACVDEAEKLGMQAWLYDEDRWPSGAAGGLVTKDDRFKMKELRSEFSSDAAALGKDGFTVGYYLAEIDAGKRVIKNYRETDPSTGIKPGKNEVFLRIYWQYHNSSSWFNGETYLDTMDPEAVGKFIAVTHEKYRQETGDKFGGAIPGIFTDEPNYLHFSWMALPWTAAMPEKFQEKYHCSITGHLPELFFDPADGLSQFRWQFFDLATELFTDAFSRQIGSWCEKNSLKFTGHVLSEDSLTGQVATVGAAMRFYEYMQVPGIDLLTEIWNIFTTVKQCTSAARQFGKPLRLSETYGTTGWDFPLAGHKALGDWQYALGINCRCQHLAFYSMAGEAKRDYPASISYQSPWYKQYHVLEDHFARLGAALTGTEEIRKLLFIHPIESRWCNYLPLDEIIPVVRPPYDTAFEKLTNTLLAENLDFDYGDEVIMAKLGKVDSGTLKIGKAEYQAVLIPQLLTIRQSTLELLHRFALAGGMVCYLGKAPEYVDAVSSSRAQEVFRDHFHPVTADNLISELSPRGRVFSLKTPDGKEAGPMLAFTGRKSFGTLFFVTNTGAEFAENMLNNPRVFERNTAFERIDISLALPEDGKVYELDTVTGKISEKEYSYSDGQYHFSAGFAPRSSRLFLISREAVPAELLSAPEITAPAECDKIILPATDWKFRNDEPNCLLLDHAGVTVDGVKRFDNQYILTTDSILRKELGGNARGEAMPQPWCCKKQTPSRKYELLLDYRFNVKTIPHNVKIALEEPEKCRLTLNGQPITTTGETGWFVDRAIRTVDIPEGVICTGENHLLCQLDFDTACAGLEYIFILGRFGVDKNDAITNTPETLNCGNWCKQSFPYYSGAVTYSRELPDLPEGKRIFLEIPHWAGSIMEININDSPVMTVGWPPESVDLTGLIKPGEKNILNIKVVSHRRNAFGPFYLKDKWTPWMGPKTFCAYETDGLKLLVPCGLLTPPVLKVAAANMPLPPEVVCL